MSVFQILLVSGGTFALGALLGALSPLAMWMQSGAYDAGMVFPGAIPGGVAGLAVLGLIRGQDGDDAPEYEKWGYAGMLVGAVCGGVDATIRTQNEGVRLDVWATWLTMGSLLGAVVMVAVPSGWLLKIVFGIGTRD